MPITIKAANLKYKDSNGEYVGVNSISDMTTSEQLAAINTAGTNQTNTVNNAGTIQVAAVNSAGATQTAAVNSAGATQVTNIQNKGTEVLESIPNEYSELSGEVDTIKSALNDKAPVIISSASGDIASFDDGADGMPVKELNVSIEPVQDLHGYDNPWPAGGGKNIGLLADTTVVSEQRCNKTYQNNGVTLVSTGQYGRVGFSFAVTNGETYTVSCKAKRVNTVQNIYLNNANEWNYSYGVFTLTDTLTTFTKTFTATSDVFFFGCYVNAEGSSIVVEDFMLEKSSSATSFVPYSNICPITGWTGANVWGTGRNLLNASACTDGYYISASGVISADNTSMYSDFIPVKTGTYVLSLKNNDSVGRTIRIHGYDAEGMWLQQITTTNIASGQKGSVLINVPSSVVNVRISMPNNATEIQLEPGSTAHSYESYTGATLPLTWQSSAGTVYGGSLTVNEDGTGRLSVTHKTGLADGTTIKAEGVYANGCAYSNNIPDAYNDSDYARQREVLITSDKLKGSQFVNIAQTQYGVAQSGGRRAVFNIQGCTTVPEYNAWLQTNTPTIRYELAEPIVYELTALEVLETLKVNNIWADTGAVEVTYRADTKAYVDDAIPSVPVQDVQVNGTSILNNGVANVPVATENTLGVIKTSTWFFMNNGVMTMRAPSEAQQKAGNADRIVPVSTQHKSVFWGLAKAAGDSTQSASSNAVGTYTESAKSAIAQMLGGSVSVSGTTPSITALPGVRYVCGEVSTIDITTPESGVVDIVFTSGSTPAVLTVTPPTGMTMKWANGFDPTALEANTTYEINIMDGCLGVAGTWT